MGPSYSRLKAHQSKKFVVDKKTKAYLWWFLLLLIVVLFIISISRLSYIGFLSINDIDIRGSTNDIIEKSKEIINAEISKSYLGLFSKANSFLYPHDNLVRVLEDISPKIKSVTIKRQGLNHIIVNIIEKNPVAVVCAKLPEVSEDEQIFLDQNDCYLVDSSGFVFDRSASSTENLNHYYVPALPDSELIEKSIISSYATSSLNFSSLQNFYDRAIKSKIKPKSILVKDGGEYEMYVGNTVIYFNDIRSLDEQFSNLVSFWNHSLSNGKDPGEYEYLDIRYGSNVFYR